MAPHFASELWSGFVSAPNRINTSAKEIKWDQGVLEQTWPEVDLNYCLELVCMVSTSRNSSTSFSWIFYITYIHIWVADILFNKPKILIHLIFLYIRQFQFLSSHQNLLKFLCLNNYVCIVIRIIMHAAYVVVVAVNIHLHLL
jgi:leucyl-tRNA synthetase